LACLSGIEGIAPGSVFPDCCAQTVCSRQFVRLILHFVQKKQVFMLKSR